METRVKPTLRPATLDDLLAVRELQERAGYREEEYGLSYAPWENNPALAGMDSNLPIGWVLEANRPAGKQVVGYLGNIHTHCRFNGETLLAAAASGYAVDPLYRGYGLLLADAFFKQDGADLLLNTSANLASGKIFEWFGASPLPQPDYSGILFWILRPRSFANSVLRRAGLHPWLAALLSPLPALLITVDMVLRRRNPKHSSPDIAIIDSKDIGEEFDDLWQRNTSVDPRLLTERTSESLRWHFAARPVKVLRHRQKGRLTGYAVLARDNNQTIGLTRSKIVDIFVEQDDAATIGSLLTAALRLAKNEGSDVLEVIGFPRSMRNILGRGRPYARVAPGLPYYFLARDSGTHSKLQEESAWYACPMDGDASL